MSNTVAARNDYTVNCDINICTAFNCIKAYAVKYQQAVALGSRELAQFQQQNFQILIYCNLYNLAIECQKTAEAKAILEALGDYMSTSGVTVAGCDCGCGSGSTNSTEPTAIYPLYNSAVYNSATELARGIIELATQTEVDNGVDAVRAVTPATLFNFFDNRVASETIRGVAKVATDAQVTAGLLDDRIITPLKLANYIAGGLPAASETASGVIEIATQAETNTGTDDVRAVTPLKLATRVASEVLTGIAELAIQAETDAGTDDARIVTPLKLQNKVLNASNTASGIASLTLNKKNGILTYSQSAGANATTIYNMTNSLISSTSIIRAEIRMGSGEAAILILAGYNITGSTVEFKVYNAAGAASGSFNISFTILNA